VLVGGTVSGDTVSGQQTVYGKASGTIIASGGLDVVFGTANGTTVSSGSPGVGTTPVSRGVRSF
jgi:autotransporter passenger strand-loop-strand repeat protein